MNMNGCQGGAGPFTYLGCWSTCNGDYASTSQACVDCKKNVVSTAEAHPGLKPEPRLGVCGDLWDRESFTNPIKQIAMENLVWTQRWPSHSIPLSSTQGTTP